MKLTVAITLRLAALFTVLILCGCAYLSAPLKPNPGTNVSLRRYIDSLENGQPNYDEMSPDLARSVRTQLPSIEAKIKRWGALKSISYKRTVLDHRPIYNVSGRGTAQIIVPVDEYDVAFEHGHVEWFIGPFGPDGKVFKRYFHEL